MTKKVILLAAFSEIGDFHRSTLEQLFGDAIQVDLYCSDQGLLTAPVTADLFIISIYQMFQMVRPFIPEGAKTVFITNTLTEIQYQQMASLHMDTPVLAVNFSVEMTMETITLFHQLGLDHLDYVPCYPGIASVPRLDTAVTVGESKHVPRFVKTIIDIGNRVMDARTIIDIATSLGLEGILKENRVLDYFKSIRVNPDRMTWLFNQTSYLEEQISSVLDVLDDGIILIAGSGLVSAANRKAHKLLGTDMNIVGVRAADLIPGVPFAKVIASGVEINHTLVEISAQDISVKAVPMRSGEEIRGALAIINTFDEQEKKQQSLRSQLLGKGHRGRYTFDDILTQDPDFQEIKQVARKKARSDASVLIIGETGTGKELLAHAIHNASHRKGWQFVTVNCAAIPESLLESELFGYEEGAFTGARKGGKPGIFELAHKGTIFLDEIGEMDLGLQARLLRVIEGREVMRIGGDRMISVDIRIIAATNRDLGAQVEEGRFRRDLFYRLNVLPIQIPPLRQRTGDILFLMDHLKRARRVGFELTPAACQSLLQYPWRGNVRELKNLVDHLATVDKVAIDERDLAPILRSPGQAPERPGPAPLHPLATDPSELDPRRFLLECLDASRRGNVRIGRRRLHQQALENDLLLSEAEIRRLLIQMEMLGYVKLASGRGGTTITRTGIAALGQMRLQVPTGRQDGSG